MKRQKTRSADVDYRSETLTEFARELGEFAGSAVPFAATVLELATVRAQRKLVKERRALIYEQLRRKYDQGTTRGSGGLELRLTRPPKATVRRVAESATVRKHAPAQWEQSRVLIRRVAVSSPAELTLADQSAVRGLPGVPRGVDPLDVVARYYRHPKLLDCLDALNTRECAAIEMLEDIATRFGWNRLPMEFTDGWRIGLRALQYSSDQLAIVAPAVFDQWAVEKIDQGAQRVYIATAGYDDDGNDIGDEYAE